MLTKNNKIMSKELQKDAFSSETMTSREIAELTGRQHKHLMRDIRIMEVAWEKVNGSKFGLVNYTDPKGEKRPMYQLTKIECLYIATKFNDEARAKLVLRWEELESRGKYQNLEELLGNPDFAIQTFSALKKERQLRQDAEQENLLLNTKTQIQEQVIQEAAPKVEYYHDVLSSESLIPINVIAKEFGMSGIGLNKILRLERIIYRSGDTWVLFDKYQNKGYTGTRTMTFKDSMNRDRTVIHTYWTEKGREFIHNLMNKRKN